MIAITRTGKNTAPGRLRRTATSRARARITTSATRKYSMFRTNFLAISGKLSRNSSPLKNACLTAGQFFEWTITHTIAPNTTTVLTTAITTPLAPSRRSPVLATSRDRRPPPGTSGPGSGSDPMSYAFGELTPGGLALEDRDGADVRLLGQPLLLEVGQGPVVRHGPERLVHACHQRIPLLEGHPDVVGGAALRVGELSDDDAVLHLLHERVGDVQRGRQVDHHGVHLVRVEGGHRVGERRVRARLRVRLDDVGDVRVRRRSDRRGEVEVLEVLDARRRGDRRSLDRHQRLVHVVVAVAEVDGLGPLLGHRDLLDGEVPVLGPGRVRLGERRHHPLDLVLREPEPLRDLEGNGALEPLAVVGVVDLPHGVLGGAAREPRRVRRVVGADRELPPRHQGELVGGALVGGGRGAGGRAGRGTARRAARGRGGRSRGRPRRRRRGAAAGGRRRSAVAAARRGQHTEDRQNDEDPTHRTLLPPHVHDAPSALRPGATARAYHGPSGPPKAIPVTAWPPTGTAGRRRPPRTRPTPPSRGGRSTATPTRGGFRRSTRRASRGRSGRPERTSPRRRTR